MNNQISVYKGHRFPKAVISHAVWLYYRFSLSYKEVEELLAARGRDVNIRGKRHYLWRAVDQDGDEIDILVQHRRNKQAALRFFSKLFQKTGIRHHKIVTDKLRSAHVDLHELSPEIPHMTDRYQNNRAKLSHQPTRLRERKMRRFKSQRQAQQFLSFHGLVNNIFKQQRHLMKTKYYRILRDRTFAIWQQDPCVCWAELM